MPNDLWKYFFLPHNDSYKLIQQHRVREREERKRVSIKCDRARQGDQQSLDYLKATFGLKQYTEQEMRAYEDNLIIKRRAQVTLPWG